MKTIKYYLTSLLLMIVYVVVGQPDTSLVNSTRHLGTGWGSNGGYTTFGMAGHYVQGKIAGGDYTGKIGYLLGDLAEPEVNEPPVAISTSVQFYYELGDILELDGYDPEGQQVEFEITREPQYGTLSLADGVTTNQLLLTPNANLLPDVIYEDTLEFQVNEVNSSLSSNVAQVVFKFFLQDTPHEVTGLDKTSNTFALSFADTVFNAEYGIDINYYNLSDPLNAFFVNVENTTVTSEDLDYGALSASYSFEVDESTHSYLFTTDQVLVTALVTAPNGYSSFNSFIVDNAAGGRILASEDGDYFVVGSDMSVPENKSVAVKLVAVDFAGFDAEPTVEWTKNPDQGVLGSLTLVESSNNIRIWETTYTATAEVGGDDDFTFRVFNPIRNSYESGEVTMAIQEVNDVPQLADIPDQQWAEDDSKSVTLTYADSDNALVFDTESDNPDIMAEVVDGVLVLSSTAGYFGQATINVWVQEVGTVEEYLVLKQLDVEVTPVNDAPILEAISDQFGTEDMTLTVDLEPTDDDGDVILFTFYGSISDPSLATLQFSGNSLNIIPRENSNGGPVTVTVVADDGSGASNALSNTVSFEVTFDAVNDAPVFVQTIPNQTMLNNGVPYDLDMGLYVSDVETAYANLIYSTGISSNQTITFSNGIATITPTSTGTGYVRFYVEDPDGVEINQEVRFQVNALGADLIVANALTIPVLDEDFGIYNVDLSDVFEDVNDADAVFTYDLLGETLLNANISGSELILTSLENANGSNDVVLVGTTGGESIIQNLTITISDVNDVPVISGVSNQTVKEDGVLELILEIVDPEGDPFTYTVESSDQSVLANANIVETNSLGDFYFIEMTPEADQNGIITITITADDGDTSEETFALNVSGVNDLPYVNGILSDLNQEGSFNTDITTLFDDIDSETLTYEVESKPEWMSLTGDILSGSPTNENVGIDQVTILASDAGGSIRATFEFEIININDAPETIQAAGIRSVFTGEAFSFEFPEGNFKDIDEGDALTFTVESKPDWLANIGGTVSGTPTLADVGQSQVVYRATDGSGAYAEDILTLNISELTYDVTLSFTQSKSCLGGTSSVSASGAFDYKWYDDNDELLQDGGSTFESTTATTLFVVGVDGQSTETNDRFETSIDFNPLPEATLTQEEDLLKVADVEGYTYTWSLDESNISEATGATYEPTESGSYQVVVVSDLGCSSTSNALDVTIVIPEEQEEVLGLGNSKAEVALFPVPAHESLTLRVPNIWQNAQLTVVNLQGQEVFFRSQLNSSEIKIDLADYESGIYFMNLRIDSQQLNLKFIKE
ncbi:Ig-like domain-containing protein [Reichenbachiella sp.]|uniref:T9SS type A sorting domain-containing protein n=1 Tax=Reichenbachiella sp. TaxID=2184521 RepID=UPI003B598FDD